MSEQIKPRIVVQNTTQRLIVIGGAGFNGMKSGHGIGLVPGFNEVDADLWEACKGALAYDIENNTLIPSEKANKDGKAVPVALKDMDPKEQDKVIKACLDVKQLVGVVSAPSLRAAIRAPWGDGGALSAAIATLRRQGETVVCVLPGHGSEVDEFHCDRELVLVDGNWVVKAI